MSIKWIKVIFTSLFLVTCFATISQAAANSNKAVQIKPYSMSRDFNPTIRNLYRDNQNSHSPKILTRLLADSDIFMGKPYQLGPLGEGHVGKFDQEPLYRTEKFDCVTFVETVLALAESNDFNRFRDNLLDVRYADGVPCYLSRNHFTSVDWNPNSQKLGYITDDTKEVFPETYKTAVALINKPDWYQHLKANNLKTFAKLDAKQTAALLDKLHALGKKTKAKMSRLPYEPLSALFNKEGKPIDSMFARIPSAVIIEIIRPNWDLKKLIGTNLNISHLGLGVRINGKLYYREASSLEHKVVDERLETYLAGYLNSPTVKGISIQKINLVK